MDVAQKIRDTLARILSELGVTNPSPTVEFPADFEHGDLTTNVALAYGKGLGKNPHAFADEIAAKLDSIYGVARIEIAGPGFINFHLAPECVAKEVEKVIHNPETWGRGDWYAGKKLIVEYTDPNPFKEFHIGHLMSNTIGESIARLTENAGAKVVRANYQGDVGLHVAKAVWGKIQKPDMAWGEAYAHGAQTYEDHKDEIDEINKKIYDKSDEKINTVYQEGLQTSLDVFERIYASLGTKFDHYFFESETGPIGKEIVEAHTDIFLESDGARVFRGEKYGLHTRVFINSQGLPTYEAKELGLEKMKADKYPDADMFMVITGNEIIEYFKVVKKALELLYPEIAKKLLHMPHGMMRLQSGKMSSRTGDVITAESLLNDLTRAAKERANESRADNKDVLAQQVAVAAIKYQILKQGTGKDIIFDEGRALSLEGDSGPYLQYTHARARALLEKGSAENNTPESAAGNSVIERMLVRFPHILERAVQELTPQHVTTFLTELAGAFNAWYAQEQILDGTPDALRKLAIVSAVAATLKNGLHLLGIEAPERM